MFTFSLPLMVLQNYSYRLIRFFFMLEFISNSKFQAEKTLAAYEATVDM